MTKKLKSIGVLAVIVLCCLISCLIINIPSITAMANSNIEVNTECAQDDDILQYYHEPTLEENFENNIVNVILKNGYFGEIGFDDFNVVDSLSEISAITYKLKTINKDSNEKFLVTEDGNPIFKLKLSTNDKAIVLKVGKQLQKLDIVLVAEPNYIYEAVSDWTPNDMYYDSQWGLKGSDGISAEDAWDITTGSNTVKVGIFEGGADRNHEDLSGRVFIGNYAGVLTDSHGTHVAGIIGATQNSYGIAGVSQSTMYTLSRTSFVDSLAYATENDIKIINASFSYMSLTGNYAPYNATDYAAIKNYDGLLICAAGNKGVNTDTTPMYPACYDLPNVISVGAINERGERASFSNYGDNSVSIYAPGDNILSTYPQELCTGVTMSTRDGMFLECECILSYESGTSEYVWNGTTHHADGYHFMSGTSMAAPHVTGVAALLLSKTPTLTGAELKKYILETADDITIITPYGTSQDVKKLNAYKALEPTYYYVTFDKQGGQGGDDYVHIRYGEGMPAAEAPTRNGYIFKGYYSQPNGNGTKYYDGTDMVSVHDWNKMEDTKLYACWEKIYYTVTLHHNDGDRDWTEKVSVAYGEMMPVSVVGNAPKRAGYEFVGYYSEKNGNGTQYYSMVVKKAPHSLWDYYFYEGLAAVRTWDHFSDGDLYAHFKLLECDYTYNNTIPNEGYLAPSTVHLTHGEPAEIKIKSFDGYSFSHFYDFKDNKTHPNSSELNTELIRDETTGEIVPKYGFYAVYKKNCIAEGTLITLANGEQVPVEQLTGDEMLLVWNLFTGTFDTASILFIDSDPQEIYQVINLYFSDGTQVKVISEHAFWDFDLNRYVYLDKDASEYIGHWFNKQTVSEIGEFYWTSVQLADVIIQEEYTAAYSPVTYGHLCYYVDGMLSMPGGIGGLFNIFEVDANTMSYDAESMQNDIEQYGLFTYEEFYEILPVARELFEAVNGQYLKVAIGKGLIDLNTIASYINKYSALLG